MDDTRVDADDVVEKILQSQDFTPSLMDSSAEGIIQYLLPYPSAHYALYLQWQDQFSNQLLSNLQH